MADNLPPSLTLNQLQGASRDLAGQGAPREVVQGFVDNYHPDGNGNFVLKTSQNTQPQEPTPESGGAVKQADGTYRAPTFLEGLGQAAQGIGKAATDTAIGLGQAALSIPGKAVPGYDTRQAAIKTGEDIKNKQLTPENQAQQGGYTAEKIGEVALPLAETAATAIENVPKALKGAKSLIQGGTQMVGDFIKGGTTDAKIFATAPEDVAKLTPKDQTTWFNNKNSILEDTNASKIEKLNANAELDKANVEVNKQLNIDNINKNLQTKNNALDEQATNLQKELSQKGNKSASDLRTSANQLAKDKSIEMGKMKAQAIAGKEDINLKKIQLSGAIDGMTKNPDVAAVVKNQLGISGTGRGGNITLGEISDRLTSLRAQNNYNPADYATNEAVKVLENILKKNGVDNSAANAMWSKWIDTKNAIDSSFDIYSKSGITTDTAANKLIKAAQGDESGAGNANFIQQIEKMTGGNFTSDIKDTLSKLDVNQKTALANSDWAKQAIEDELARAKINTEAISSGTKTGITNANTEMKAGKDALAVQQRAVARQSALRNVLRTIIKTTAVGGVSLGTGVAVDKTVKKFTGVGF